jgi:hypothetical protein
MCGAPIALFSLMIATMVGLFAVAPSHPAAAALAIAGFTLSLGALAWSVMRADVAARAREIELRWAEFESGFRAHVARLEGERY